jgi:predicted RNase H-like HicB family nuclease
MQREYEVIYQEIEDGWVMATVPDLPGAVTQGQNMEEARANIREAIDLVLASYREHACSEASSNATRETVVIDVASS